MRRLLCQRESGISFLFLILPPMLPFRPNLAFKRSWSISDKDEVDDDDDGVPPEKVGAWTDRIGGGGEMDARFHFIKCIWSMGIERRVTWAELSSALPKNNLETFDIVTFFLIMKLRDWERSGAV